jgi:RNA polymerase sigma-70 factor, ECF subfamily
MNATPSRVEEGAVVAAVRAGDETAFAALVERYRRQLHVHCYRMLGSVDDADDLVQETFLNAWRGRRGFEGRSSLRTWLYRIATNACLRALERTPRRRMPQDVVGPVTVDSDWSDPPSEPPTSPDVPWLQPYPDQLFDPAGPQDAEPEEVVISRETIEIAYLTAIQQLPPRQRAVLVLRHTLGWSAKDAAEALDMSVPSVNSALQRARATLQRHLPRERQDWTPVRGPTVEERLLLRRFVAAWDRGDAPAIVRMMREDARWVMPPFPLWFEGRAAIAKLFDAFPIGWQGELRFLATAANRQPAMASYLRPHGGSEFRLAGLTLLSVRDGLIRELATWGAGLPRRSGLPATI